MRFEILGQLRVHTNTGEVTISSGRERTLLAVLLLHANRTVPNDQLVEAIWAEQPPPGARNQLQGCVSRLRKRLAATGLVIVTEPAGYRANLPPAELDLLEFRRLVAQARTATATGDHTASVDGYRAALDLWRGPALGGIDTGPVHAAVALDEEHILVQEECIEAQLAAGGAGRLVPKLTELVGQHPHRERLHHALMLALYRADRQADALAAYRHARTTLHDELGIEPGTELQRLHQAILNRDPDLHAPPTPTQAHPAASSQPQVPRELPADVAGFTGRAEALQALDELLDRKPPGGPPAPVVISAIAGTAGVGKTALVLHWAHQVADRFPHGQLYLNLRGYATTAPVRPIEALSALLRSLGTSPEQIPTDEAQAAALYRTQLADRRALIVLDNARSVDQVRPLLPGAPGCLVLVTSRDRLTGLIARDGATRLTLDVLTPEEAQTLLSNLLGPDRTKAEPAAIDELARACAHLPLALRIAAAHLTDRPDQSISAYVAGFEGNDRLAILQADGDDASAVRTALSMSYETMPVKVQRTFRLLGLVPGPDFTPPAVAAITGVSLEEAARQLRQLAGAHLVEEGTGERYSFHDLLRRYALRLTSSCEAVDQRVEALNRLFSSYLCASTNAADLLYPQMSRLSVHSGEEAGTWPMFRRPAEAMSWLDAERSNLVAVAITAGHLLPRFSWLLAGCLRGYFWRRRHMVDWFSIAGAARTAADRDGSPDARASALFCLADANYSKAHYREALKLYSQAAALAEEARWSDGQSAILCATGVAHRALGQLSHAASHLSAALTLPTRHVGTRGTSNTNLGIVYHELGELNRSVDHLTQALKIHKQLGAAGGAANDLINLGCVYYDLGRLDHAREHAAAALELQREAGNRPGEIASLGLLAEVCSDAGCEDEALCHAHRSRDLAIELDDSISKALSLMSMGNVQLRRNHHGEALTHHQHALNLARSAGYRIVEAQTLLGIAYARLGLAESDLALQTAQECHHLARLAHYRVMEMRAATCLAEILFGQARIGEANKHAQAAIVGHRETGHRLGEARTLVVLGHLADATGEPVVARRYRDQALARYTEIGAPIPASLSVRGSRRSCCTTSSTA